MTSTSILHVAVIPDGNGRWAEHRGLCRSAGHERGVEVLRRIVEAAPERGIRTLTVYAFSADNWQRPAAEVAALMALLERFLRTEVVSCREQGVRLEVIGRRDRLAGRLVRRIEEAERSTASGTRLDLRLAVDYSARQALRRAARLTHRGAHRPSFEAALATAIHGRSATPPVDLVIRTSGEMRLSDFLLWESAYAELVFLPALWPDLVLEDLDAALAQFHARQRRFGALPAMAGATPDTVARQG